MGWLLWGGLVLPVMLYGVLMTRRVWRMAYPQGHVEPPGVDAQAELLAEVGARLASVAERAGSGTHRAVVPRLGPDERAGRRFVPPPQAGMALRIKTSQGSLRADVADLSQRGFAAHVASARAWRQGEVLCCTLELIGRPYADVQLRTRYVVFGGDEDPSWRIGFQLAEGQSPQAGRAMDRLVDACEAARLAA